MLAFLTVLSAASLWSVKWMLTPLELRTYVPLLVFDVPDTTFDHEGLI